MHFDLNYCCNIQYFKSKNIVLLTSIKRYAHFVDVNKMSKLAKGAQREAPDILLTWYACYLIAQNGDPRKSEIALP
jgi:hypothetical protein